MPVGNIITKINNWITQNTSRLNRGDHTNEILNDICAELITLGSSIAPYDDTVTYIGGLTYYVSYNQNIYKFISLTDQIDITPGTDPAIWELTSIGQALAFGGAIPILQADAEADAIAGDLLPGALYAIQDAWDGNQVVYIRTLAPTLFEPVGTIAYENATMSAPMWMKCGYDVTGEYTGDAGYIFHLHEFTRNNEIWQFGGADTISKMPFDDYGTAEQCFANNYLVNVSGTWNARRTVLRNVKARNCTINSAKNNPIEDVRFENCDICENSITTLTADTAQFIESSPSSFVFGAAFTGHIGYGATVHVSRASIGNYIGDGKTVDTSGWVAGFIQTNGRYDGNHSTFGCDGSFVNTINPDGANNIDIANAAWCGFIGINDTSASATVDSILNATAGDRYVFYVTGAASPVTFNHLVSQISLSTALITLTAGTADQIEFQGGGIMYEINSVIHQP